MDGSTVEGGSVKPPAEAGIVQQAEIKKKEAEGAWSSFMDTMEASKETQGDFFLELGEKTTGKDTRALILREPFTEKIPEESDHKIFVVMTADGPKGIDNYRTSGIYSFLEDQLVRGLPCDLTSSGFVKGGSLRGLADKRDLLLVFDKDGKNAEQFVFDRNLTDADMPKIDEAITNSIAKAESPHIAKLEASQKQIGMAKTLSDRIGQFPPK